MPCPPLVELLAWTRSPETDDETREHVLSCPDCSSVVESARAEEDFIAGFRRLAADAEATREDELPRDELPGYEILELIARGGQGVVYRARQEATQRLVAVKILRSSLFVDDRLARERFEREIRVVARLRHPHLVTIFDAGLTTSGRPAYAMELIDGRSLDQELPDGGLPIDEASGLFRQIASAVVHAHEHGIIHRDLKPRNVLLDTARQAHVLDFGLAKWAHEDLSSQISSAGSFAGTLRYAAPEQVDPTLGTCSERTDVHALGLIFYELLTGKSLRPADGSLAELVHHAVSAPKVSLSSRRLENPSTYERAIEAALATRPDDRPASVPELLALLDEPLPARARIAPLAASIVLILAVFGFMKFFEARDPASIVDSSASSTPTNTSSTAGIPMEALWRDLARDLSPESPAPFGSSSAEPLPASYWRLWNAYRENPFRLIVDTGFLAPITDTRLTTWRGQTVLRAVSHSGELGFWDLEGRRVLTRTLLEGSHELSHWTNDGHRALVQSTSAEDEGSISIVELDEDRLVTLATFDVPEDAVGSLSLFHHFVSDGEPCLWVRSRERHPRAWLGHGQRGTLSPATRPARHRLQPIDDAGRFLTAWRGSLTLLELDVTASPPRFLETPIPRSEGRDDPAPDFHAVGTGGRILFADSFRTATPKLQVGVLEAGALVELGEARDLPHFNLTQATWSDEEGRWLVNVVSKEGLADVYRLEPRENPIPSHTRLRSSGGAIAAFSISEALPSGPVLVLGESNRRVSVIDIDVELEKSVYPSGDPKATSLEWLSTDPRGGVVVTGNILRGRQGFVSVLDGELEPMGPSSRWLDPANTSCRAAIRLDGNRLLSGGDSGILQLVNADGDVTPFEPGKAVQVNSLQLSPDSQWVAWSAEYEHRVWIGSASDPRDARALSPPFESRVPFCAFSPDGGFLAAADRTGNIGIWELSPHDSRSARSIARFRGHDKPIRRLRFSPDQRFLLTSGDDQRVQVWESGPRGPWSELLRSIAHPLVDGFDRFAGHFYGLDLHPHRPELIVGDSEGNVFLMDWSTGAELASLGPVAGMVMGAAYSADGRSVYAAVSAGEVRRWDLGAHDPYLARGVLYWGAVIRERDGLDLPESWRAWARETLER